MNTNSKILCLININPLHFAKWNLLSFFSPRKGNVGQFHELLSSHIICSVRKHAHEPRHFGQEYLGTPTQSSTRPGFSLTSFPSECSLCFFLCQSYLMKYCSNAEPMCCSNTEPMCWGFLLSLFIRCMCLPGHYTQSASVFHSSLLLDTHHSSGIPYANHLWDAALQSLLQGAINSVSISSLS